MKMTLAVAMIMTASVAQAAGPTGFFSALEQGASEVSRGAGKLAQKVQLEDEKRLNREPAGKAILRQWRKINRTVGDIAAQNEIELKPGGISPETQEKLIELLESKKLEIADNMLSDKDFMRHTTALSLEAFRELEKEAKALNLSFQEYTENGTKPVWEKFATKMRSLRQCMEKLSSHELIAEYYKLESRRQMQKSRFLADNESEIEKDFDALRIAILNRLGLQNMAILGRQRISL